VLCLGDAPHRGGDLRFGDGDLGVDHGATNRKRDRTGFDSARRSIGEGLSLLDVHDSARLDRAKHARGILWPHADDLRVRAQFLERRSDPTDQTATTDRHEYRVEVPRLFVELDTDRALSSHDIEVVVGRDIDLPLPLGLTACEQLSLNRWTVHDDQFGAARANCFDLRSSGRRGHVDGDADTGERACMRHGLAMIARRCGHYARTASNLIQHLELVGCPANFERAGRLQMLALEQNLTAQRGRQSEASLERRDRHSRADRCVRVGDVLERQRHTILGGSSGRSSVGAADPRTIKSRP